MTPTRPGALALVAIGLLAIVGGLAPAGAALAPAAVTLSTTTVDPGGGTVTVTGTGFDPTAHVGTRPPLAGQPSGIYVVFGRFAATWRPSEQAPSSAREVLTQRWALPEAQRRVLDPTLTNPDLVTLAPDGTFTVDLPVAPGGTSAGDYGVATYAGSGAVDAAQETFTAVTFEEPSATTTSSTTSTTSTSTTSTTTTSTTVPSPTTTVPAATPGTGTGPTGQLVTVAPVTDLDPDGQDVLVTGSGFDSGLGIYVALCVDQGATLPPSPCLGGSGEQEGSSSSAWITDDERFASLRTAPFGPGGTFSVTLHVTAADELVDCYDPATTCVLATRADHTATTDRSADVRVPVWFEGQVPPTDPQDPDPAPTAATLDRTEVVAGGTVTVSGEGFLAGEQVQSWLHSDPVLLGVAVADPVGAVATAVTIPAGTPAGTHTLELVGVTSGRRLTSAPLTVVAAAVTTATTTTAPGGTAPVAAATPPVVTTGTLPVTGGNPAAAGLGAALVLTGLALVATTAARRRGAAPVPTLPDRSNGDR